MYDIPDDACESRFVHASGPGGQHVNKASTAVELKVYIQKLGLPPGAHVLPHLVLLRGLLGMLDTYAGDGRGWADGGRV